LYYWQKICIFHIQWDIFAIVVIKKKLRNFHSKNTYVDFADSESGGLKFVNNLEKEY